MFSSIAVQILPLALGHFSASVQSNSLEPFLTTFANGMLRVTLQPDPEKRKSDASALPIHIFARDLYVGLPLKLNVS